MNSANNSEVTSLVIPNTVDSINNYAFYNCIGLTSVTIPNSVTSIGEAAFAYCRGLSTLIVDANNATYDSRDNCNAIIETSSNTLIVGCNNSTIPYSVTSIGNDAFFGCYGLTSVTIPNSVTSIGNDAFYDCIRLTSVTIPNSVTSIGTWAFYDCYDLTSVNYTGTIADWCNISFGNRPANPLYYAHHLYINNSEVTSLVIPNTVDSINNFAFYGCRGLTSVTIPNSVTSIGDWAFEECSGLTSVTIGNSVTSIGDWAFEKCSGLQEITSLSQTAPALGHGVFFKVSSTIPVNIPCGSLNSYSSSWFYFSNFVEFVPDGIADAEQAAYTIRTTAGRIVVEGINKETVRLFDCAGRCLQTVLAAEGCTIQAPAAGVYLLQIGNNAAQKVVVLK